MRFFFGLMIASGLSVISFGGNAFNANSFGGISFGASAQTFETQAEILIKSTPAKIQVGYNEERFTLKAILWMQVLDCWGEGGSALGAKRTCLICTIDETGGMPYPSTDFRQNDGLLPSTSVGFFASYAYFSRRPTGWTFERYAPFSANYTARSREPYHRANLNNLIYNAPEVCNDLAEVSGYE